MQQRKIIAVPLLVYVAENHTVFAARDEEYIETSLLDYLQLKGVAAFAAGDYDNATVIIDQEKDGLCTEINKVCRFIPQQHPDATPFAHALNGLLKRLGPHFDAGQGWEDHQDALDYCSRQNDPDAALLALAIANYGMDEKGWAGELLKAAPYKWEVPKKSVLETAIPQLKSLGASYEHPGYIDIVKDGIDFAFGNSNGDYSFDFSVDAADRGKREGGESTLSRHASATALANWIIQQVRATCEKYPLKAPVPELHLHLNVAIPLDRPELLVEAWHAGFLACDPETTQVFVYDEDYPDSPRLMEFARRHSLEYVGTTDEGERRPWVEAPVADHSPGPWSQDPEGEIVRSIEDARGIVICNVHLLDTRSSKRAGRIQQGEANLNLIESAPDMLKSLVTTADYLATFCEEGREHRVVREADAVIAKATNRRGSCPT